MWGRERERERERERGNERKKKRPCSLSLSLSFGSKKTHVTAIQASNHSESKKRRSRSVGPPLEEEEEEVETVVVVAIASRCCLNSSLPRLRSISRSPSLPSLSYARGHEQGGIFFSVTQLKERESGLRPFSFYQSGDIGDDVELKMRCLFGFSSLASPFSESLFER